MDYVVEPQPTKGDFATIDDAARRMRPSSAHLMQWFDPYITYHRDRFAHDLAILREYAPKDGRILELGSLPPIMTAAIAKHYQVTGVDIAPERFEEVLKDTDLKIVKCNIEQSPLPFKDGEFNCVLFNELFEHLRINPIFTLRETFRVLAPNGILLLSTPNLFSWIGIKTFLFSRRAYWCGGSIFAEYEKLQLLGHMGHVREYTPREVVDFLQAIGFKVSRIICRGESPSGIEGAVVKIIPRLRRFISVVAIKQG